MRLALLMVAALLVGSGIEASATAQPQGAATAKAGNVPEWGGGKNRGSELDIQFFDGFSYCIATRAPDLGEAFVASHPGSEAQGQAAKAMMEEAGYCLFSGSVKLRTVRLRGAVAEALMKTNRKPVPPGWLSASDNSRSLEAKLIPARGIQTLDNENKANIIGRVAAFCTVENHRTLVADLLRTRTNSGAERTALTRLNPAMSQCLGRRHMRWATAPRVRAFLAEALYWRRGLEENS